MKMKRLLSTILAIAMVLVLCPSTQIIFAEGELIPTKISGTVTATSVAAGSPLATSVISGAVITDDGNDTPVEGTFKWNRPTTWLTESGTYAFTFVPKDPNTYASCSGEAVVLLNFDKDTAVEKETILEQYFDDENLFQVGVAGDVTDNNEIWKGIYAGAAAGSHVISGTNIDLNPPADKHNVFHNNRVLALKRYSNYGSGTVNAIFYRGNAGKTTDFVASFRVCRVADKAFYLAYGGGSYELTIHNLAIKFDANGDITLDGGSNVIGNLAKNVWATVNIVTNKGGAEAGPYTITIVADDGTTIANTTGTTTAYGLSNLNQVTVFAIDTAEDGTTIAYFDDIYVQRKSDDVVCLDQDFDGSDFVTDQVYAENVKVQRDDNDDTRYEEWKFLKNSDGTGASIVADIPDGDYYTSYAYSGYQSLYIHRPSGNHGQISVGTVANGTNTPYIDKNVLTNADDFEYSFRLYWLGGAMEVYLSRLNANAGYSSTYLSIAADGKVSVFGSADDTTTYTASTKTLAKNAWSLITVTADRSEGEYVVKVNGEEFKTGYLKDLGSNNSVGGLIFRAGFGAQVGYLDDVTFDKVTLDGNGEVTERTNLISQSFENTNHFDSLATYSYAANGNSDKKFIDTGAGGYWLMQFANGDYTTPLVINTHDGDGLIDNLEQVYSENQAMKVVRVSGGNALDGQFRRKLDYTTEDYRLSFKYRATGDNLVIAMGHPGNFAHADAAIGIASGYQIQKLDDQALVNTTETLQSHIWYNVTLETNRSAGTYKVTFVPLSNGFKTIEVVGELTGTTTTSNNGYVRFYAGLGSTAGYIDDVKLVTLTPAETARPTYTASLPDGFESDETPALDQNYTFRATNTYYNYTFNATTGGQEVAVTDNGDGTYTLGPVGGDVAIEVASRDGKSQTVTLTIDDANDVVDFANTAKYDTDYALKLNPADGYNYSVAVTIGGEEYELADPVNNIYTIEGTAITGAIEITVTRELKTYDVTFTGNGAGNADGAETATHGQDYTFTVNAAVGVDYTVIFNEEVLTPVDGVYTIPGAQVTDALTIQVGKVVPVRPEELVVTVPAGGALKDATIETQKFVDAETGSNTIPGTITWTNPALWMNENREVEYTFTPEDTVNYKPYTGTVMVTLVGEMSATPVMGLQNFDDTGKFVLGAAGAAVDGWTYGESTVVSGTNPPADKHNVFHNNRVLALKYMNLNSNCPVLIEFPNGNMNLATDFVVRFRIKRVDDAAMWVGLGNGQFDPDKQHAAIVIGADGAVTIGDATESIGTLEKGVWATVEMVSNKVGQYVAPYTVTVTPDNGTPITGTGTTKDNKAFAEGGYNSTNVNKLIIRATSGTNATAIAYLDDVYVERKTNNPVQVNQSFDNPAVFVTDQIYTSKVTGENNEVWDIKTTGDPANGSCVVDTADGDYYAPLAYSGHQSLYLNRGTGGNRQFSVGHVYGGSNFPYFAKETLYKEDDFEYSFRFYWTGGAFEVFFARLAGQAQSQAYLSVNASGAISVFGSESDTSTLTASTKTLPLNEWCKITVASDRANNRYTVSVNGEEFISGYVKPDGANSTTVGGLIFKAGYNARAGYLDDVSFDKIVLENGEIVSRTSLIFQNFENTNAFDTSYNYTAIGSEKLIDIGGTDGYWKMQFTSGDLAGEPLFINTHDGDGLVTDFVYSNDQALKLSNGNPFQYALAEAFTAEQNYTFSARVFLNRGKAMTITFADAEDAADAVVSLNNTVLMPITWATVTLKTDRDTGKYTVTVTPDNGAEYEVQGDLAGKAVSKILFATESDGTAAFVDNVSLAKNDLIIADKPVYQVTLPSGMVANNDAVLGEDFVFAIGNNNYTYTNITATMDGNAVQVADNGNGTYTITNVCGDIEVSATVTPKSYNVTVSGSAEDDVSAPNTATYDTNYVFTVEKQTGYTYEVVVRWTGGQVAFTEDPDGTYTILGANILGDLTITVNKTVNKYAIDWQGNALEDLAGKLVEVEHGQEYSFIVNEEVGYDYTVTVGGEPLALVDGKYTIAQGVITGPITIAVNKELTSYTVSFSKQPAELEVTGEAAVQHGAEYTFRVPVDASYSYTVSAAIGGNAVAVTDNGDGSYTIAAGVINGDLTISIFRLQVLDLNFEFGQLKVEAGKALGTLVLTGTATDAQGNPVAGTFAWVRPSTWMNESKNCAFIFTPDDATIAPVEGTVTVSIYSETMDEEVILDQNFDDENLFQVGVAGDVTDNNEIWKGIYAGAAAGSHVISGTNIDLNPPADKHNVFHNNRVLALKYMNLNNNCPVLIEFPNGNMNQANDFVVRFRIKRVDDAAMWVGLGNGQLDPDKQHAAVVIGADGAVTIGDATESIGTLEKGVWATVEMVSNKDGQAVAPYTVTVTPDNGTPITGTGTTKGSAAFDEGGYNSSNVNKLVIRATSGTNATAIAYLDDVYVERKTNNPVQVNQSFDDPAVFVTDQIYTSKVTGESNEAWDIKTTGDPANGSCVVDTADGDHYTTYAYSGHQSLYLHRPTGNHGQISVGREYSGSNYPYIPVAALSKTDDFEYSFRFYWIGGAFDVHFARLYADSNAYTNSLTRVNANGTISVFGSESDTSTMTTSTKTLPLNEWCKITVASDRANNRYTVSVNGEEFASGYLKDASNSTTVGGLIFRAGYNAQAGYLDDVQFRNLTTGATIIDQSFENTSDFDSLATYSYAVNGGDKKPINTGAGGYWLMQFANGDYTTPLVINTHDGDGLIDNLEQVYSENQAMKVVRVSGGSALDGQFRRKLDYTTEDYRLSFKYRATGDNLVIAMGHPGNFAHADAVIGIASGYQIQKLDDQALVNTTETLQSHIWYNVTLETNRSAGTYNVTFVPLSNGFKTIEVVGELTGTTTTSNNGYVCFYAGLGSTAGYIDDVKLVALTAHVEDKAIYTADLADGISGAETAALDSNYTFTIDGWTVHKDYTFDATMGGNPVEVIDNGDGTYTIEGVYGDIVIDNLASTGKPMNVTIDGTGVLDITGSGDTVIYGDSYTFTVNMDENYNYSITVTVDGDEIPLPDPVDGAYTIANVTGELVITVDKTEKVINVNVDWGGMNFEYEHTSWDAETHSWNGAWNPDGTNYITVTNIGGVAITVSFYFAERQGVDQNRVTDFSFTNSEDVAITEPVPLDVGAAAYTAYLNLTGAPTAEFENEVLGTATVEIQ